MPNKDVPGWFAARVRATGDGYFVLEYTDAEGRVWRSAPMQAESERPKDEGADE